VHIRPFPSDSTTHTVPVSATAKFAPLDGRNQDVRRSLTRELDDELREIRLDGLYALLLEMLVELGLVARDGLDLYDLFRLVLFGNTGDDAVGLLTVPRPVDVPTGASHGLFKLQKVLVQVSHHARLERMSRLPELLPVGHLLDGYSSLSPDGLRGLAQVSAQLCIGEALSCGLFKVRGSTF
jgi:hypothetical protein